MWMISFVLLQVAPEANAFFQKKNLSSPIASGSEDPIQIQSDSADLDNTAGNTTHRGNVVVKQKNNILHCDVLIIHKDRSGKIDKITATGNPASFEGTQAPNKPKVQGRAKIIEYFPTEKKMVLQKLASLTQGDKTITGALITYSFQTETLSSESDKSQRTTVILQPGTFKP